MSISENVAFDDLMNSKHSNDQRETFIPQEVGKSRIVNHQPSQNTMTNQPNPSCWEALQNLRDLNVGAPFVDCLFDLHGRLMAQEINAEMQRKRVTEKDYDSANNQLIKMIERPEHTITIDGVTYYSAKHYKPKDGEAVTGYAKGTDWISYSCLGIVTSDPVWRPVPFTVWYEYDKSCWYTYDYFRQGDCKINVIAWTHLPHPKCVEEFQDFGNSL